MRIRPANGLPLSRPRAFTLRQRDATLRADTRRGSAGPTNGTRSAAAAELGGPPRYSRLWYAALSSKRDVCQAIVIITIVEFPGQSIAATAPCQTSQP